MTMCVQFLFFTGHLECIHAETCTDFIILLVDLFGETPGRDLLTGVCIDRACDVHPYVKRPEEFLLVWGIHFFFFKCMQ